MVHSSALNVDGNPRIIKKRILHSLTHYICMFVHWSNNEVTYRHMESIQVNCEQCGSEQKHTFRMYEQKTKHYSVLSVGSKKSVTVICHGCLLESPLDKEYEKQMIAKFTSQVMSGEGFELYQQGEYNKAMKKFKKNLKNEPGDLQSVYGLAICLIAQGNYDEARGFVDRLDSELPDDDNVRELKQTLLQH